MKTWTYGVLGLFLCWQAQATSSFSFQGPLHRPPSFQNEERRVIFGDFQSADYKIVFDENHHSANVTSVIKVKTFETGHLAFDLVEAIDEAWIDGVSTTVRTINDPDQITQMRVLMTQLHPGEHELVIRHRLQKGVDFSRRNGVHSGFFMADLSERNLLEDYLPSSFEYDQVSMTLTLEILRPQQKTLRQNIFTNGEVQTLAENKWKITFPPYFTCSSLYFHTAPVGDFAVKEFTLQSVDGRTIPVTIYGDSSTIASFPERTVKVFRELEADYGPWPHAKLVIYGAGRGGMEYCGATRTSLSALGHEMTHSYFARGIMPANGNAGWFDEAVASWRDNDYPSVERMKYPSAKLGGHGVYRRSTDSEAYTRGAEMLAHIDYLSKQQGGLKVVLRDLLTKRLFQPYVVGDLVADLEAFYGGPLDEIFDRYVYGTQRGLVDEDLPSDHHPEEGEENPHHPRLSKEELRALL